MATGVLATQQNTLQDENQALQAENQALRQRIAELERIAHQSENDQAADGPSPFDTDTLDASLHDDDDTYRTRNLDSEMDRDMLHRYQSDDRFMRLFEANPVPLLVERITDGMIVAANTAYLSLSMRPSEEVVGHSSLEIGFWESIQQRGIALEQVERLESVYDLAHTFPAGVGEGCKIRLTLELITLDDAPCLLIIIQDITEWIQHRREREALITVASAMRAAATRAEMIPMLLEQVSAVMQTDGTELIVQDQISGDLIVERAQGMLSTVTGWRMAPGEGISGHVIATGQPYITNNVEHDPYVAWPVVLTGVKAVACVPLITQEQTIGALAVACRRPIADDEVRLLNAIGDMTANTLHRVTLYEQIERRLKQVHALHNIDQTIASNFDLGMTLHTLVDHVITLLNVDAADVLLFNPITLELEYAAGRGFRAAAFTTARFRLGECCAGRVALERRFLILPDLKYCEARSTRYRLLCDENLTAYYGIPLIARGQIKGVLELFCRHPQSPEQEWLDFLHTLAGQAAIAIDNAELFAHLQSSNDELMLSYDVTMESWARALELRDTETEGHSRRVTTLTLKMARTLGFNDEELIHIRRGAVLHDVGKMAIPDHVLLKNGPLTDEEQALMRQHPIYAYEWLSAIPFLKPALDIPYCHHEKWDGTGYPRGLKGEDIPFAARVFSVVDVWDALVNDRPYRKAWPKAAVCDHIQSLSGSHFDPQIVDMFLYMIHNELLDEHEEEE